MGFERLNHFGRLLGDGGVYSCVVGKTAQSVVANDERVDEVSCVKGRFLGYVEMRLRQVMISV